MRYLVFLIFFACSVPDDLLPDADVYPGTYQVSNRTITFYCLETPIETHFVPEYIEIFKQSKEIYVLNFNNLCLFKYYRDSVGSLVSFDDQKCYYDTGEKRTSVSMLYSNVRPVGAGLMEDSAVTAVTVFPDGTVSSCDIMYTEVYAR